MAVRLVQSSLVHRTISQHLICLVFLKRARMAGNMQTLGLFAKAHRPTNHLHTSVSQSAQSVKCNCIKQKQFNGKEQWWIGDGWWCVVGGGWCMDGFALMVRPEIALNILHFIFFSFFLDFTS